MSFFNTLRKIERIRFYISMIVVGVFFIVVASIAISMPKTDLVSVSGTIDKMEAYTDSEGETMYNVFVSYVDKYGTHHKSVAYPSYSSSMKEGDSVKVLYDPKKPDEISAPGGQFIPYILLIVGIAAILFSVKKIKDGKDKANSASPFENNEPQVNEATASAILQESAEKREYYFHWTGKMNQSYILETPEREAVCKADCDHIGFFTPYRYTFTNCRTGKSIEHIVTHTKTTRLGSGAGSGSISVVDSSSFKIDGVDNFEYLSSLGYTIKPTVSGIKVNIEVLRHGVSVAFLEAAGTNILKDDKKSFLGDKLPATGLFKVSCADNDIEGVFVACFCASRVEFF